SSIASPIAATFLRPAAKATALKTPAAAPPSGKQPPSRPQQRPQNHHNRPLPMGRVPIHFKSPTPEVKLTPSPKPQRHTFTPIRAALSGRCLHRSGRAGRAISRHLVNRIAIEQVLG